MKRLTAVFLGFLVISSMVAADPLYKWVDDQGNVHYSDKPQPGAKKIVLPKASTYKAPVSAQPVPAGVPGQGDKAAAPAASVTISSPADQETIWNIDSMTVNVSVSPGLQAGDTLSISLDGNTQTGASTSATFGELERGPHTVNATVSRADGSSVSAKAVTFFIQKTSVKKPPTH